MILEMSKLCDIPPYGNWRTSSGPGCKIPNIKEFVGFNGTTEASRSCMEKLNHPESRVFIQIACVPK
jgi:hypothetical protein